MTLTNRYIISFFLVVLVIACKKEDHDPVNLSIDLGSPMDYYSFVWANSGWGDPIYHFHSDSEEEYGVQLYSTGHVELLIDGQVVDTVLLGLNVSEPIDKIDLRTFPYSSINPETHHEVGTNVFYKEIPEPPIVSIKEGIYVGDFRDHGYSYNWTDTTFVDSVAVTYESIDTYPAFIRIEGTSFSGQYFQLSDSGHLRGWGKVTYSSDSLRFYRCKYCNNGVMSNDTYWGSFDGVLIE